MPLIFYFEIEPLRAPSCVGIILQDKVVGVAGFLDGARSTLYTSMRFPPS